MRWLQKPSGEMIAKRFRSLVSASLIAFTASACSTMQAVEGQVPSVAGPPVTDNQATYSQNKEIGFRE
ncbi:MAG TPA: hypothetical protein DCF73_06590 [Rhodobiaceae bacterium]|nr:hypothetical protein [Rhodobiaceae bacterium]